MVASASLAVRRPLPHPARAGCQGCRQRSQFAAVRSRACGRQTKRHSQERILAILESLRDGKLQSLNSTFAIIHPATACLRAVALFDPHQGGSRYSQMN